MLLQSKQSKQCFTFTNCNLLFYIPNLDDDTLDPILEDYLHFDEQLRIYPNNFTLPRTWPFDRQLEISIIDQKDKNNKWSTYFPNYSDKNNQDDTHAGTYTLPELMREDFIPHTKLLVNFREAFLNNDSVILQIKFNDAPFEIPSAKETPLLFWPTPDTSFFSPCQGGELSRYD